MPFGSLLTMSLESINCACGLNRTLCGCPPDDDTVWKFVPSKVTSSAPQPVNACIGEITPEGLTVLTVPLNWVTLTALQSATKYSPAPNVIAIGLPWAGGS